jgi:transcriptional regulator with PAS, ATPase and Fis domain
MSSVLSLRRRERVALQPIVGVSPAILLARTRIERFAKSTLPVLLVGPTGTGKEVLAQHLHALSGRRGELVEVNCGALPRDMVESLLFGHRKGAFTGASESAEGLVARAHQGTLFLDELSSLPPEGQAKLLRVLETGEFLRLGDAEKRWADFRVVAAVPEDIGARVDAGLFRGDLFYRVAGFRIDLPPLHARREDIGPLAEHFAQAQGCVLAPETAAMLIRRPWPGNVRQLRVTIERAAVLANDGLVDARALAEALEDGPEGVHSVGKPLPARAWIDGPHADLLDACRTHGARSVPIAAALGISRATLFRRLRACGISLTSLRVSESLETP